MLSAFKYSTFKTKQDVENTALAMIFLSNELHYAADKKQVLQLSDIWQRYTDLAKETN